MLGRDERSTAPKGPRAAFLGNHTPRQCGIATFTADLSAIRLLDPESICDVVAMNDVDEAYAYPEAVRYQVSERNLESYRCAASFLNDNGVDVLSLQHEYGIFGGQAGAHVLTLLRELRMPVVTTLHTILAEPSAAQQAVMDELCALSTRLVVMSAGGVDLLRRVHGVSLGKVDLIRHGIPVLPNAAQSKLELGLAGKRVLLTFGLLSPDKGIEYVIDGLVEIAERYPDVVYVVLGATHPQVKARHGEAYRHVLQALGERARVSKHLVFHDRFVNHSELVQFLAAADIYVTPYLNLEQITSGTLAYAVGSGKAVVSSPYRYARELLADGYGVLVPVKDGPAIARAVLGLFGDSLHKQRVQERAAALGAEMLWPVVARSYQKSFQRAVGEFSGRSRPRLSTRGAQPTPRSDVGPEAVAASHEGLFARHAQFGNLGTRTKGASGRRQDGLRRRGEEQ